MIVLDASIILKWFIQEPDSGLALKFKERYLAEEIIVAVPDLILYEIPNVLRYKGGISEQAIKSAVQDLLNLQLEIVTPAAPLIQEAIHLSFATRLSLYDCTYLALANELDGTLITADEKLWRQAKDAARVKLLSTYKIR